MKMIAVHGWLSMTEKDISGGCHGQNSSLQNSCVAGTYFYAFSME
jgi:hypothetical protein